MFLIRRFDPEIHHRRSIRLRGFDYTSPGAYFVTVCALDRNNFFGIVEHGVMKLNQFGRIVDHAWNDLPNHNPHITLDAFVVMPDQRIARFSAKTGMATELLRTYHPE
jgi:putative transposase